MNKYLKAILSILVLVLLFVAQKYSPLLSSSNEEEKVASSVVEEERVPVNQSSKANDNPNGIILPIMGEQDGVLIEHEGFTLLFDTKTMCPRWVAWELTAEETRGKVSRTGVDFKADNQVPEQYQVASWDYNGGHYGRGHMCPAGDMKWSQQAMQDCHYMTNICPQTAELNKTWWEHLERACRSWARQDGSVQIVCGPVFSDNPKRFGKKHRMAVPKGFYKVVLSLKEGKEKAIGFYYTNDDAPQPMEDAVRSVDDIEQLTGIDFFSSLPDEQEDRLEAMTDLRSWDK
ncbi:MAG: DNA/RNA non-specific endonuclease [Bacteroidaceae bacterium]|nr:DNA/RNA non-specific endonuclease [Bacteroidaceae bacterium]